MFDFAWSELALIAVVALVVIGPKDLPRVMRVVGQWTRRARAIAREFQGSLDQMMREAELDEVKRHIDRASSFNVDHEIRRTIDPTGDLQRSLSEPVLTNPMADPPKPIETAPLPAPALETAVDAPLPAPAEAAAAEAPPAEVKPAVPEPEKPTP
jgi:sec-independent protein translocase protein TatB